MKNKLLTLQDLCDFYSTKKKSMHFSAEKNGEALAVQVDGIIAFDNNDDHTKAGLTPVSLQACHIGRNLNSSAISDAVMTKSLPSFSNRPILGYIHEVDGEPCFYGHNFHIEDDELVYDEIPVGIIPESCDAKLVYDKEKENTYVEVSGYIFNEYTKAAEILQREKQLAVSVELSILECSYNAKEKCLNIEDMYFSGVTILQKDRNGNQVKEGMKGSNIKLKDFSESQNSMFSAEIIGKQLIETLESVNATLSKFNIKESENYRKEDENVENDEIKINEEVTETEGADETVTEEVTETSTMGVEVTETESESETSEDAPVMVENEIETESDFADDKDKDKDKDEDEEPDEEETTDPDEDADEDEDTDEEDDEDEEKKKSYSIKEHSIEFELSHNETRYALYQLLEPVMDANNTFYCITDVYDDYFVYEDCCSNEVYGQKYIKTENNVSYVDAPYELFKELLTQKEKEELDKMRSTFIAIKHELNTYKQAELKAQLEEILNDAAYAEFAETDGFKEIREKMDTYSVEELRTACDLQFAKEVKSKGRFSMETKEEIKKVTPVFAFGSHEPASSFLDGLLKK